MLESNFNLVNEKFVECCISILNYKKFARLSPSRLKRDANFHIGEKSVLCMLHLFIRASNLHIPATPLKLELFLSKTILI